MQCLEHHRVKDFLRQSESGRMRYAVGLMLEYLPDVWLSKLMDSLKLEMPKGE